MATKKAAKKVVKKDKEKKSDEEDEVKTGVLGGEGTDDEEEEEVEGEEEVEEEGGDEPEKKDSSDVVFVNREKHKRAQGILDLVTGKRVPRDHNEVDRIEHYRSQMNAAGVDPKSKKALRWVYELLGGLVRSESEQRNADKKAAAQKAKFKKNAVEKESDQ